MGDATDEQLMGELHAGIQRMHGTGVEMEEDYEAKHYSTLYLTVGPADVKPGDRFKVSKQQRYVVQDSVVIDSERPKMESIFDVQPFGEGVKIIYLDGTKERVVLLDGGTMQIERDAKARRYRHTLVERLKYLFVGHF